ncbi:MAG TPA: CHAD domain-containing protein [Xanthobacteraceae bacterium]|nr:CHAD domain-containing protein [Xanthobacteraceae bacterium]
MPPQETELKLDVAPSALPQLLRSVARNGHAQPRSKNIVSVYFDTPDFQLRKAGFTLRVRRDGRRRLQTVKQEGERAALLARNEWEQAIRGNQPDIDAARGTGLKPFLTKKLVRRLKPMFETSVRRTIYPVRDGITEIELALDQGRVVAGRKSSPLHEVELELKTGAPVDLFRLARLLGQDVPLQLSLRTKAERGYALLEGKQPVPVTALPVGLTNKFSTGEALQAIARACLHQMIGNQPLIRIGKPEGLHQMRVALRRLRAALSLFSPILTDTQSQELKSQLRWLNGELNAARELDVFITRVAKLVESRRHKPELAALLKDLRRRRAQAYAGVRSALSSFRFRDLVLNNAAWIEVGDWTRNADALVRAFRERPIVGTAADELQRRCKKIRKHGRHLRKLSPSRRHKLRIQAKKVRYAAEFFAAAFPGKRADKRRQTFVTALEKLQDTLGELNDISVHEDLTAGLVQDANGNGSKHRVRPRKAFAAGRLAGYEEARTASVLRDAERAYRVFARVKPFWR